MKKIIIYRENNLVINEDIEQILINHKSSLNALLNSLKKFQEDYFSKENDSNKIKLLKKLLTALKGNLTLMKQEKKKQFDLLMTNVENRKNRIKEILFPEYENKNNYNKDCLTSSYIKQKNELNILNFIIENEIEKANIMNETKNKIYLYTKHIPFYLNLKREIYCNINQENSEIVFEILKNIRTLIKNEFISTVKERMEKNLEINTLSFKIKFIKDHIKKEELKGSEKYIRRNNL